MNRMAREILFKAKRIDNGEWVKGYLVKCRTSEEEGYAIKDTVYHVNDGIINLIPCVVEESTICQYTGLKDRNGRKIFENDVVFVTDDEGRSGQVDTGVGEIDFLEGLWYISGNVQNSLYDINKCFLIEVIGNIFDNPELLGGADNG